MKNTPESIFRVALLVAIGILVSACATKTVSESDRDTSGKFDGSWIAQIDKAPSPQTVQNWRFKCNDFSGDYQAKVTDGEIEMSMFNDKLNAYVSKEGTFKYRAEVGKATASLGSDIGFANPNIALIISGNLAQDPGTGEFLVGFAEVGYAGCKSKIKFKRG